MFYEFDPAVPLAILFTLNDFITDIKGTTNVALKKSAWQSSDFVTGRGIRRFAKNAVDGNRNPISQQGSCSHTRWDWNPWLVVDLKDTYIVNEIVMVNRGGCCAVTWMHNFTVEVANQMTGSADFNQFQLCYYYPGKPSDGEVVRFSCNSPVGGRYVKVQMFESAVTTPLIICELEVYAMEKFVCNKASRDTDNVTFKRTHYMTGMMIFATHTSVPVPGREDCLALCYTNPCCTAVSHSNVACDLYRSNSKSSTVWPCTTCQVFEL